MRTCYDQAMINGVVLQKLETMDKVLAELRSLGSLQPTQLEQDWRTRRAVERDLQVLVEIVIDICQRIISLLGASPATTAGEAIRRCIETGVLSDENGYRRMVQFRNIIVHRYEFVDPAILADMVNRRLDDFERFRSEVLVYVSSN